MSRANKVRKALKAQDYVKITKGGPETWMKIGSETSPNPGTLYNKIKINTKTVPQLETTPAEIYTIGAYPTSKIITHNPNSYSNGGSLNGIPFKQPGGQLKKYQNPDGPILQMPKFLTAEQATKRHADIANYYFHEAPTVSNLYNGVTNWLKSKMILTPDGTGLVTGTAPMPTKAKNAKEALEMVRAMKAAKAAKSGKPNISTKIDPVKDSWMTDYILRSSKSTQRARAAQARGRKATDTQVRQTTGRGPIQYRTGKHTNRGAITTDDIYE